jgi:hypothetical protein
MAKKRMFLGMLAMALAFGFVVMGCDTPLQDGGTVKIDSNKAPGPGNVEAVPTTANLVSQGVKGVIVSWDAAENASGYQLYVQQEDKKTIESNIGTPQNNNTYASSDGAPSVNTDPDKWSALVQLQPGTVQSGKKYRFGVQTNPIQQSYIPSDIVWSDYITAP